MRLLYITLLLLLASCDPGVNMYYTINNNSDSTVYVYYVDSHYHYDSIVTSWVGIPPWSSVTAAESGRIGRAKDQGSDFLNYLDTFIVYNDTSAKTEIRKPFRDRNQWQYHDGKKKMMSSEEHYTLTLTNEDV